MSARHAYFVMILLVVTPSLPLWARWIVGAWLFGLWLLTFDERDDQDAEALHITTDAARWN